MLRNGRAEEYRGEVARVSTRGLDECVQHETTWKLKANVPPTVAGAPAQTPTPPQHTQFGKYWDAATHERPPL
ncbi:MAG: hypothetical protein RIS21_353, partial [Planctomycetota bacterium]